MSAGISGYSRPSQDGGVTIDVESMMLDLIMVIKAGGIPKAEFINEFSKMFDECHVEINIPKEHKQ